MKPKKKLDLSKVRTRYDPPTLEQAIFAAQGLADDIDGQVQIAAGLMGQPESEIRAAVQRATSPAARSTAVRIVGAQRTVVVERRGSWASGRPRSGRL